MQNRFALCRKALKNGQVAHIRQQQLSYLRQCSLDTIKARQPNLTHHASIRRLNGGCTKVR
jgi:hypothetical protein